MTKPSGTLPTMGQWVCFVLSGSLGLWAWWIDSTSLWGVAILAYLVSFAFMRKTPRRSTYHDW